MSADTINANTWLAVYDFDKKTVALHGDVYNILNFLNQAKQDLLVSGTNIKTINGMTILDSGNIEISGSGLSQQQIEGLI